MKVQRLPQQKQSIEASIDRPERMITDVSIVKPERTIIEVSIVRVERTDAYMLLLSSISPCLHRSRYLAQGMVLSTAKLGSQHHLI